MLNTTGEVSCCRLCYLEAAAGYLLGISTHGQEGEEAELGRRKSQIMMQAEQSLNSPIEKLCSIYRPAELSAFRIKWRHLYTLASISRGMRMPLGEGTVQWRQTLHELTAGGCVLKTGPQILLPSQTWVMPPHVHCNPCPLLHTSSDSTFFRIWEALSSLGKKREDGWPHDPEPLT